MIKFADLHYDQGCFFSLKKFNYVGLLCNTEKRSVFKLMDLLKPSKINSLGTTYINGIASKGTNEVVLMHDFNFEISAAFDFVVSKPNKLIFMIFMEKMPDSTLTN